MELGRRFDEALAYAAAAHRGQLRKGTAVPYIAHPLAVCALVLELGGDVDQAAAALLHDVVEDRGAEHEVVIRQFFGDAVADMVRALSDDTPAAGAGKRAWRVRKEAYLAHLAGLAAGDPALLVCACDKLHNLRALRADLARLGEGAFAKFNAGPEDQAWYYRSLVVVLQGKLEPPVTDELAELAEEVFAGIGS